MTITRKVIIAFWIFIFIMLVWQIYSYNSSKNQEAIDHPQQTTFIFLHTNAAPVAPTVSHPDSADIQQTGFVVQPNTPSEGSFTCLVTLKNMGHAAAKSIQISVRPYRGVSNYDEDVGHQNSRALSDDDPTSRFNDWLSFPDLAPGESSTRPVVFTTRPDIKPGTNPNPQILFETDKNPPKKPAAAPAGPATIPATPHHGVND